MKEADSDIVPIVEGKYPYLLSENGCSTIINPPKNTGLIFLFTNNCPSIMPL